MRILRISSNGSELGPCTKGRNVEDDDPPWENVPPQRTISFTYNTGQTAEQNGANLKAAMQSLVAGDKLQIGAGTYSINSYTTIDL
jgi:hypothetical protein